MKYCPTPDGTLTEWLYVCEAFWSQVAIAALMQRCEQLGKHMTPPIYGFNDYIRKPGK